MLYEVITVLVESARIARGKISDLKDYDPADFDAIVFPGGFGAAKNLSTFAFDGPNCTRITSYNVCYTKLLRGRNKKSAVGTISYMPPLFGCHIASVVLRNLLGEKC